MQNYDLVHKKITGGAVYKRNILFILFLEEKFQKEYNSSICTLIFSKQEQKNNNPTLCIEKRSYLGKIH